MCEIIHFFRTAAILLLILKLLFVHLHIVKFLFDCTRESNVGCISFAKISLPVCAKIVSDKDNFHPRSGEFLQTRLKRINCSPTVTTATLQTVGKFKSSCLRCPTTAGIFFS